MRRLPYHLSLLPLLLAVPLALGLAQSPPSALAVPPSTCAGSYTTTGETACVVPANARSVTITAIGGGGGGGGQTLGGQGGAVTATFAVGAGGVVRPRETLYIEVGGNGSNQPDGNPGNTGRGGANGGGDGGDVGGFFSGGGGGGASDVRTCSVATCTPLTTANDRRILVAAGGGGGGASLPGYGNGGNAGQPGANAFGGSGGGGAGTASAGGAGGVSFRNRGPSGANGSLGVGGAGSNGIAGKGGGGGGGGYYGGGGGGANRSGAGGGGGSNFVIAGGTGVSERITDDSPKVTISISSGSTPHAGQPVTFTAYLTCPGSLPSGAATFQDGVTALGRAPGNGVGRASLRVKTLIAGMHTITATVEGDRCGTLESVPLPQTVRRTGFYPGY